jgi:single-stranded-DNA-specific exonuclease
MNSVSGNNWEEIAINQRIIEKVKNDFGFSEILSRLIISRKFDQNEIDLINNDVQLSNPFIGKEDFKIGIKILSEVIKKKQRVLILGDYDVDGCVSSSLFINFFNLINNPVDFYIPNRFKDGYGASLNLIKKLSKKKPELIIMVDCGSNSTEAIKYLKSKNIKSIIIDHHEIYRPYPKCDCLINPKKVTNYDNYDYLCSSALTFFFIDYSIKLLSLKIDFKHNLSYVLLATICDVMPLRGLNKILAKNVLKKFKLKDNFLFDKILSIKKINRPLEINDFGFLIGPILNSPGRLNDANIVVKLLTSNDVVFKLKIINQLILDNEKRKIIEANLIKEIDLNQISKIKDNVIVIHEAIINEGIIGIIASKLKEYFNKPCVVLTKSNNFYKASARSNSNFNIGKYVKHAIDKKIILKGGGHNLAAGFTIQKNKIQVFKSFINAAYAKNELNIKKNYISKISLNAINKDFFDSLKILGPFGQNNSNPFFLIDHIKVLSPRILKNNFVSFYVKTKSTKLFPCISFTYKESSLYETLLFNKNEISLIVQIKENIWNNKKKLQLVVLDAITDLNKA